MNLSRRCFIGTALGAVAGCRTADKQVADYLIEVRARNSFGRSGKPIAGVFHRGV